MMSDEPPVECLAIEYDVCRGADHYHNGRWAFVSLALISNQPSYNFAERVRLAFAEHTGEDAKYIVRLQLGEHCDQHGAPWNDVA